MTSWVRGDGRQSYTDTVQFNCVNASMLKKAWCVCGWGLLTLHMGVPLVCTPSPMLRTKRGHIHVQVNIKAVPWLRDKPYTLSSCAVTYESLMCNTASHLACFQELPYRPGWFCGNRLPGRESEHQPPYYWRACHPRLVLLWLLYIPSS